MGYKYNKETFNDLYVKGFKESLNNISTDSSDDLLEEQKTSQVKDKEEAKGFNKSDYLDFSTLKDQFKGSEFPF